MQQQQDWYLHEGPPADRVGVTPDPRGVICGVSITVSPATEWGSVAEVGDVILAQLIPSQEGMASIPASWRIIHESVLPNSESASAATPGSCCTWAYGFYDTANETFTFANLSPAGRICGRFWLLKNVDRRVPVDYVYLGMPVQESFGREMSGTDSMSILVNFPKVLGHRGRLLSGTRHHAQGALQVTNFGCVTSLSASELYGIVRGPEPLISTPFWAERYTSISGAELFSCQYVAFDQVTFSEPGELTGTRPYYNKGPTGGKAWGQINASLSWTARSALLTYPFFKADTSLSTSMVRAISRSVHLDPGQYVFFTAGRISNSTSPLYLQVIRPDSSRVGHFFMQSGIGFPPNSGAAFTLPFAIGEPGSESGTYNARKIFGGEFTATDSGIYELRYGVARYASSPPRFLEEITNTQIDQNIAHIMVGLCSVYGSQCTPTLFPWERTGPSRRLAHGSSVPWRSSIEGSPYTSITPIAFSITPRGVQHQRSRLWWPRAGHGFWSYGQSDSASLQFVGGSWGSIGDYGMAEVDRQVWGDYFASAGASVRTVGKYYLEVKAQLLGTSGANNGDVWFGLMAPSGFGRYPGVGAVGNNTRRFGLRWIAVINEVPSSTYTGTFASELSFSDTRVYGFALDFSANEATMYLDGSAFCTLNFYDSLPKNQAFSRPRLGPWRFGGNFTDASRYLGVYINTTGPFEYKPAGFVAWDWTNEVP
jgi:hypothetical protein